MPKQTEALLPGRDMGATFQIRTLKEMPLSGTPFSSEVA